MGLIRNRAIKKEFEQNYIKVQEMMHTAHSCITRINNIYWQFTLEELQSHIQDFYCPEHEAKTFKKTINNIISFYKEYFANSSYNPCLKKYQKEIVPLSKYLYEVKHNILSAINLLDQINDSAKPEPIKKAKTTLKNLLDFVNVHIAKYKLNISI